MNDRNPVTSCIVLAIAPFLLHSASGGASNSDRRSAPDIPRKATIFCLRQSITAISDLSVLVNDALPGLTQSYNAITGERYRATIVNNEAVDIGGAIYSGVSEVRIRNSVIAYNSADGGRDVRNQCSARFTGGGNNIQSPSQSQSGDYACSPGITFIKPRLGTLGNHGGPTQTVALQADSPAINDGADCPATDQRGAARNGACDLGSYEFGALPPSNLIFMPMIFAQ